MNDATRKAINAELKLCPFCSKEFINDRCEERKGCECRDDYLVCLDCHYKINKEFANRRAADEKRPDELFGMKIIVDPTLPPGTMKLASEKEVLTIKGIKWPEEK